MFNLIEDRKYQGFNIGVFNTIDEAIAEACYQFKKLSKKDKENFTYYIEDSTIEDEDFCTVEYVNKSNYMRLDCIYNNTDYIIYAPLNGKLEFIPFVDDPCELYNVFNKINENGYIFLKNSNGQKNLSFLIDSRLYIFLENIKDIYNLKYNDECNFIISITENIKNRYLKFEQ